MLGTDVACSADTEIDLSTKVSDAFATGTSIKCPSAAGIADYCSSLKCSTNCKSTGGDCIDGTCYCGMLYAGDDCSVRLDAQVFPPPPPSPPAPPSYDDASAPAGASKGDTVIITFT